MSRSERHLRVEHVSCCPFSVALNYICDILRAAKKATGKMPVRCSLPVGTVERNVRFDFSLRDDPTERGRPHDEIDLRWYGDSPMLPDFYGTVRLRIQGLSTRVIIEGDYAPPLGVLGRAFDEISGKMIAQTTLEEFLERTCAEIEAREEQWRASMTLVPA